MSASTCSALHAYVQRLDVQYGYSIPTISVFIAFCVQFYVLGTCTVYREVRM